MHQAQKTWANLGGKPGFPLGDHRDYHLTAWVKGGDYPRNGDLTRKRAALHRTNALFYRMLGGAEQGDLFNDVDPQLSVMWRHSLDYLTESQRHARELAANPAEWMLWNYPGVGPLKYD